MAFVKAKKTSKAILDVQFAGQGNKTNTHAWDAYIGATENDDPPVTHDWKRYEGVVAIPDQTKTITVAVQIYGPGDVWVDDITAVYTDLPATDAVSARPPTVKPLRPDADVEEIRAEERFGGNDSLKLMPFAMYRGRRISTRVMLSRSLVIERSSIISRAVALWLRVKPSPLAPGE